MVRRVAPANVGGSDKASHPGTGCGGGIGLMPRVAAGERAASAPPLRRRAASLRHPRRRRLSLRGEPLQAPTKPRQTAARRTRVGHRHRLQSPHVCDGAGAGCPPAPGGHFPGRSPARGGGASSFPPHRHWTAQVLGVDRMASTAGRHRASRRSVMATSWSGPSGGTGPRILSPRREYGASHSQLACLASTVSRCRRRGRGDRPGSRVPPDPATSRQVARRVWHLAGTPPPRPPSAVAAGSVTPARPHRRRPGRAPRREVSAVRGQSRRRQHRHRAEFDHHRILPRGAARMPAFNPGTGPPHRRPPRPSASRR